MTTPATKSAPTMIKSFFFVMVTLFSYARGHAMACVLDQLLERSRIPDRLDRSRPVVARHKRICALREYRIGSGAVYWYKVQWLRTR